MRLTQRNGSATLSDFKRTPFRLSILTLLIPLCSASFSIAQPEEPLTPHARLFQQKNIPLSPKGIRTALAGLLPANGGAANSETLIAQLGADEFAVREQAEQKILALPLPPIDQLKRAKAGDDPEIRMRARKLLKQLAGQKPEQDLFLFASLILIRDEQLPGMAKDLLQLAPHCNRADLCSAMWQAMRATATRDDEQLLHEMLRHDNPLIRATACIGLQALPEANSASWQKVLSEHAQPELVRFALVQSLARQKKADPYDQKMLEGFCDSNQKLVRRMAELAQEEFKTGERKTDWSDYLAAKLIRGEHGGQYTQFVQEVPQSLIDILTHEKRRANTIGPVSGRHGSDPWLYPKAGENEAPRVLEEDGLRYYPIYGTWKQQWGSHWNTLDENGNQLGESLGRGAHLGSVVEYVCLPIAAE